MSEMNRKDSGNDSEKKQADLKCKNPSCVFGRFAQRVKKIFQRLFQKGETAAGDRKSETPEERFVREWTRILSEKPEVFNGLFNGLVRVDREKAKKPERILREWRTRTRYRWEGQEIEKMTGSCLFFLDEDPVEREECKKWAGLLLNAAREAGLSADNPGELTLDERTANAYTEWDGQELYMDDTVEVMMPAWYLNGRVVEQGQCRKSEEEDGNGEFTEE